MEYSPDAIFGATATIIGAILGGVLTVAGGWFSTKWMARINARQKFKKKICELRAILEFNTPENGIADFVQTTRPELAVMIFYISGYITCQQRTCLEHTWKNYQQIDQDKMWGDGMTQVMAKGIEIELDAISPKQYVANLLEKLAASVG